MTNNEIQREQQQDGGILYALMNPLFYTLSMYTIQCGSISHKQDMYVRDRTLETPLLDTNIICTLCNQHGNGCTYDELASTECAGGRDC